MSIFAFLGLIVGFGFLAAGLLGWIFDRRKRRRDPSTGIDLEELFRQ